MLFAHLPDWAWFAIAGYAALIGALLFFGSRLARRRDGER